MVATKAAAIGRSLLNFRSSSSYLVMYKRLFSSSAPSLPGFSGPVQSTASLSHSLRVFAPCAVLLNTIRRHVNCAGSGYSPLNSCSNSSDQPPTETLSPGCDYEHWLILMGDPAYKDATKQQMIDCYVETLSKVLGSEDEAKKKIYSVYFEPLFGFGCEIDEETSNKLQRQPGVMLVSPDSYLDAENKDYGGELYVNGEILERPPPPERQRRVEPVPQRVLDRNIYKDLDRTRHEQMQRSNQTYHGS